MGNKSEILAELTKINLDDFEEEHDVLAFIIKKAAKALNLYSVDIWELRENQLFNLIFLENGKIFKNKEILDALDYPCYFDALKNEIIIKVDKAEEDIRTNELAKKYNNSKHLKAILDIPIYLNGEIFGVLCSKSHEKTHHWTDEEVSFARYTASIVGLNLSLLANKSLQKKLKNEQLKYRTILENLPVNVYMIDENSNVLLSNAANDNFFGFERPETFVGKNESEVFSVEELDKIKKEDQQLYEKRADAIEKTIEFKNKKTGQVKSLMVSKIPFSFEPNKRSIIGIAIDITEKLALRGQLDNQLNQLQFITDNISEGILLLNQNKIEYFSGSCTKLLGYTQEELQALGENNFMALLPQNKIEKLFGEIASATKMHESTYTFKVEILHKNGNWVWTEVRINFIYDHTGNRQYSVVVLRDIAEVVLAENALKESKKRLFSIFNSLDDAVFAISTDSLKPLFVSKTAQRILGYSLEEFYSGEKFWQDIIHPDDWYKVELVIQETLRLSESNTTLRKRDINGEYLHFSSHLKCVYNNTGEIEFILVVDKNVTEQVKAEARVLASETTKQNILDVLDELVWAVRLPDLQPIFVSKSFEAFYGYGLEDWRNDIDRWRNLVHPDDWYKVKEFGKQYHHESSYSEMIRMIVNGQTFYVEHNIKSLFDENNVPIMLIGTGVNKTHEILASERAKMAENLVTKLELARTELELKTLQMQMNPHFIFNALNSIQSFVFQNDVLSTNEYLSKFATLIRMFLESSRNPKISILNEVKLIRLYIEIEKMRFDDKFDFEIDTHTIEDGTVEIPTMMLQPFVENAINHGLRHKKTKGFLKVIFESLADDFKVSIVDDGVGRKKAAEILSNKQKGYVSQSLKITSERIDIYNATYKSAIRYEIADLNNNPEMDEEMGTMVNIYFPNA